MAQSAADRTLAPVLVSTSRFAADPAFAPIGASVISAEEIRASGIGNVNEAIRKLGGVYGRQSASGTQDFSLDLRGFGSSSEQNMVVLVDGIRLSENELSTALLSSVPIETVERIEIVRGGSSVLYGDGATGGTIQIITKRSARQGVHGTAVAEAGSYGHRALRASVARGWDGFSLDANASTLRADNYRDNNDVRQDNFSGGMQWASNEGRVGMRVDVARQDSRFAGALTLAQFEANPRQATTPGDFGSLDTDRFTLFAERRFGALELAGELSHREKTARAFFASTFGDFISRADSSVTQASPRLRYLSTAGAIKNELVAGLDFTRWSRDTRSTFGGFPASQADASQQSRAIYARDELRVGDLRVALGARHETFDKRFADPLAFPPAAYDKDQSLNAWELQGNYTARPGVELFAKAGRSYRVGNVDENSLTRVANEPLQPQTSHDLELGTALGNTERKVTVRVFQHRLRNEIFFDPTVPPFGVNSNLDPTRRKGVEIEASARLLPAVSLRATLRHVSAKFTEGPNAGKDIALVPRNTATLRLNWMPGNGHSADVGLQWADSQRYGGDFSNTCSSRIPAYTTLDARYAFRAGAWEFAIAGANLTDKDYFSNAFGACRSGIYSDTGRQLKLSARMDF
ncbi:MAG: outer rane hemin/siderophore receptor protein [Herminiimonas sp.]|nr:outer rane hemin/siderophore receptor protein [Herminiimonas sp.]